jgi:hypothetical protein
VSRDAALWCYRGGLADITLAGIKPEVDMTRQATKMGSCLCGDVRFEVREPLRKVVGCHCTQCRKTTGHYLAATAVPLEQFKLTRDAGLKWYRSSDDAQRGFCGNCGSTLFWKANARDYIAIAAGALDGETGLKLVGHIFCTDKGDYYDIADGDYQHPQWHPGNLWED